MSSGVDHIDARALMRALLTTPLGRIEDTLARMTSEEQEALRYVFAMVALAFDIEARELGGRGSRRSRPAGRARRARRRRARAR